MYITKRKRQASKYAKKMSLSDIEISRLRNRACTAVKKIGIVRHKSDIEISFSVHNCSMRTCYLPILCCS